MYRKWSLYTEGNQEIREQLSNRTLMKQNERRASRFYLNILIIKIIPTGQMKNHYPSEKKKHRKKIRHSAPD